MYCIIVNISHALAFKTIPGSLYLQSFFLLAFSLQLTQWINDEQLTSTILIIGYVMGFVLNPLANFSYLVFGIFSRKSLIIIPSWLIVANVLFLVIDAFYILYINAHS